MANPLILNCIICCLRSAGNVCGTELLSSLAFAKGFIAAAASGFIRGVDISILETETLCFLIDETAETPASRELETTLALPNERIDPFFGVVEGDVLLISTLESLGVAEASARDFFPETYRFCT